MSPGPVSPVAVFGSACPAIMWSSICRGSQSATYTRVAFRPRSERMNVVSTAGGSPGATCTTVSRSCGFHCPSPSSAGVTYGSSGGGGHPISGSTGIVRVGAERVVWPRSDAMSSAPVSPVIASLLRSAKSFSVNAIAFTVCIVSSPTHGIVRTRSTLHCTKVGGFAISEGSARSHEGSVAGSPSGTACVWPA